MLTPTSSPDHGLLEADERAGGSVDGEDGEAGAAGCFGYRGELRRAVRVRHDAADAPDRAARRGERPGYFRGGDPRVLYCTVRSTLSRLDTSTYRVLTCHLCRVCGFSLGCDGLEANAQREIISASRHGGVPTSHTRHHWPTRHFGIMPTASAHMVPEPFIQATPLTRRPRESGARRPPW